MDCIDSTKVSIIIPIYNAEKTIEKCINSIVTQTYNNIEIICVDDGSTDLGTKIIEKKQEKDSRIILVSQINSGAYKARKSGVLKSTGGFIIFVDADDKLDNKNAISNLIGYFKEYSDVQVVQFGHWKYKSRIIAKKVNCKKVIKVSFEEMKQKYYTDLVGWSPNATIGNTLWGKMYRSGIVKQAVINSESQLKLCEDKLLLLRILFNKGFNNLLIVPDVYYIYYNFLGGSQYYDNTVFYDYGKELKVYQNDLCDLYLPSKAKYECNIETVYYFRAIVCGLIVKNYPKAEVLEIIAEYDKYEFVKYAKNYLKTLKDKKLVYPELEFLISDYTPEEYYEYILDNSHKLSLKDKLIQSALAFMRRLKL